MRMGKFAAFLPIFIPAAGGASVPSACKSWDFFASLGDKKRNFPRLSPNRSPSSFSFFRFRRESSLFSSSVRRRNRSRNTGVKTAKGGASTPPSLRLFCFLPPLSDIKTDEREWWTPPSQRKNRPTPPFRRSRGVHHFPHGPE